MPFDKHLVHMCNKKIHFKNAKFNRENIFVHNP